MPLDFVGGRLSTTATGAFQSLAALGASGTILTSNGAGALPSFQSVTITPPAAEVFYDTGNGLGGSSSGETRVLNWSNPRLSNGGSDITYAPRDATHGDKFTINTAGIYTVSVGNVDTTGATSVAISINGSALTTNANSITYAQGGRAHGSSQAANYPAGTAWTGHLAVNDVVRAQTDGGGGSAAAGCYISITRVG